MGRSIRLFMWGYQEHFRIALEHKAKEVLESLGFSEKPKVLLIGFKRPDAVENNNVCIEPEDGEWPLTLFTELERKIDEINKTHPSHNMFYGDEARMRDKPSNILKDSLRQAVKIALEPYDKRKEVRTFCGFPTSTGNFYVAPVIQVPESVLTAVPSLQEPIEYQQFTGRPSLLHSAIRVLLDEARSELSGPEPGRYFSGNMRSTEEILNLAAKDFMYSPILLTNMTDYFGDDLFDRMNTISSLFYEGQRGSGKIILSTPDHPAVEYTMKLANPVEFRESRWARKILQMASTETALIASSRKIYGLGKLRKGIYDPTKQDLFIIDFIDHYRWQISCGDKVFLKSAYKEPSLPQEPMPKNRFIDNYQRLFLRTTTADADKMWNLFLASAKQKHGSMIVIAEDAAEESVRLAQQGTQIKPQELTIDLLHQVSSIDGTILIDPHGICYAVGIILDGAADQECTPSRGARYNSGIRYAKASKNKNRLAIVVSDDHTVDLMPLLAPRVSKEEIESTLTNFENSTKDNFHKSQNWLDKHRFYLNNDQCIRANAGLKRIETFPYAVGELRLVIEEFSPDPKMTDEYLAP